MNPFERVSIIGVGLLGGSLAKVIRKLGLAKSIVGYGRNKSKLHEAKKLNIPIYGMVDTNSDPNQIDFEIPSNDDSFTSVSIIIDYISESIAEGLKEREKIKDSAVSMGIAEVPQWRARRRSAFLERRCRAQQLGAPLGGFAHVRGFSLPKGLCAAAADPRAVVHTTSAFRKR